MSDDAEGAAEATPPKSGSKVLPILLVVNTLLVTGVLIFVMKRPSAQAASGKDEHAEKAEKSEHGEKSEKSEKKEHGEKGEGHGEEGHDSDAPAPPCAWTPSSCRSVPLMVTATFTSPFEVEVGSEGDKKAIESRTPRIRDAVIGYLSDRTEDELRGSEGLGQVKVAVTKKIDELVPGKRVKGLFTTEFIIQ